MPDRNLIGCCVLTDEPCFEVTHRYPDWHPRDGEALKTGASFDTAYQADLLLANGGRTSVTVCEAALDDLPTSMVTITRKILAAFKMEFDCAVGGLNNNKPPDERQIAITMKTYADFADNPPIGVLCVRPMAEVT